MVNQVGTYERTNRMVLLCLVWGTPRIFWIGWNISRDDDRRESYVRRKIHLWETTQRMAARWIPRLGG